MTAGVGTGPQGGDQEPEERQHRQTDAPEVVSLQGREADAQSRDDEEKLTDGEPR